MATTTVNPSTTAKPTTTTTTTVRPLTPAEERKKLQDLVTLVTDFINELTLQIAEDTLELANKSADLVPHNIFWDYFQVPNPDPTNQQFDKAYENFSKDKIFVDMAYDEAVIAYAKNPNDPDAKRRLDETFNEKKLWDEVNKMATGSNAGDTIAWNNENRQAYINRINLLQTVLDGKYATIDQQLNVINEAELRLAELKLEEDINALDRFVPKVDINSGIRQSISDYSLSVIKFKK